MVESCSRTNVLHGSARVPFRLSAVQAANTPACYQFCRPQLQFERYSQPMDDTNSERRRFLPLSEVDTGDPCELYAVPEPPQTGRWDAGVSKWVNVFDPCAGWTVEQAKS